MPGLPVRRGRLRPDPSQQRRQRLDQARPGRLELRPVDKRQLPQHRRAPLGEPNEYLAAIDPAALALDQPMRLGPVEQLYGAVMLELQPLSQLPYRGLHAGREPTQREQQLVLLGLDPDRAGRLLAEVQKAANLVAKLRERPVLGIGQVGWPGIHHRIIS